MAARTQGTNGMSMAAPIAHKFPISYPSGLGWYAVRTEVKSEFQAQMGLLAGGFEVFLPVEKVWIRHARRKAEKIRPLLPRYLFVGFDINKTPWHPIKYTDGVEMLLISAKHVPVRIPTAAIDELRGAVKVGVYDETRTGWQGAKPGDKLLLVKGPFRDFIVALKQARPKKRVDILLNLFGCDRELTVPLAWVRTV